MTVADAKKPEAAVDNNPGQSGPGCFAPGEAPDESLSSKGTPTGMLIELYGFDGGRWYERHFTELDPCLEAMPHGGPYWINVVGAPGQETLEALEQRFRLEDKSLHEMLDPDTGHQRPRVLFFDEYYIIVLHIILDHCSMEAVQVSIVLGRDFLITMEEREDGMFNKLRHRLHYNGPKMAAMGADYLAVSVCDILVDGFYPHIQAIFEEMADLEDGITMRTEKNAAAHLHDVQRRLLHMDRLVWSIREATDALQNPDNELISPDNVQYYRNCYEHALHISHSIENYRDVARGILDYYLSINSNQMNQVMKILTIIATVFIPLTFIVGVYGMNFNPAAGPYSMPELNLPYGYMGVWGLMLTIAGGMLWYFKRHHWL